MRQCEAQSRTGHTAAALSQCPYDAFEVVRVSGNPFHVCYFHGKVARGEIRDNGTTRGKSKSPVLVSWPIGQQVAKRRNNAERITEPMTEPLAEILMQEWS